MQVGLIVAYIQSQHYMVHHEDAPDPYFFNIELLIWYVSWYDNMEIWTHQNNFKL